MGLWGKREDMLVYGREPFNAEAPRHVLAEGPLTSLDGFFSRNHGAVPDIDARSWRLTVDGLVERTLSISLEQLTRQFAQHEVTATLQCAGNRRAGLAEVAEIRGEDPWGPGAISTARWAGAPLADVLAAAKVLAGAAHVAFEAPDVCETAEPPTTFGGSIPLAKALSGEVLLAWQMNGEPLPAVHGAPVRVIVPGWIGARSVKWVERVTVQTEPSANFFQARSYRVLPPDFDPDLAGPLDGISLGPAALTTEILSPTGMSPLSCGPTELSGYSFAGDGRQVARVDVSLDDGRHWVQADLDEPQSPWAWLHWRATVTLPSGETVITARAWDSTGAAQPESAAALWNPKGYANNSWARLRVTCRD